MKFIFSSGSLYTYSLARCFELAALAGFDGLELMIDLRWDTRQPDYIQRLIEQYQQPVLAVHSPFVPKIPGWPGDEVGRIKEAVKLAEVLGARVVVHHLPFRARLIWLKIGAYGFPLPFILNRQQRVYQGWLVNGGYQTLQAQSGVKLCIENMPAHHIFGQQWNGYRWNSIDQIVRFPALTLDTTHLGTWGMDPVAVYDKFQGRVQHIHLSNFDGREHRLPEQGQLRLDRLLATLATTGYEGLITLELHPDSLQAGSSDRQIVALLETSLAHCRGWIELEKSS